ncbi:unnamed protein product [Didymodactylos carnosus]|uniref:Uncharacterized protein n=1 Tax=Didymodactylos carnosus TaxID=1234261 RepID=A0A814ZNI3_9BILA|nr:unnamed protein product [Didymodactylos carnosus]CAF4012297.1 unnamed protein product [Didymodactylos carnosus]
MNVNITDEEELKSILWRLDKRLIPFLTVLYVFSFLSRISIGKAYAATKIGNYQQLAPWKWLFVLESVPGVIIGITAYFLLPKYPESGTWLSQSEKDTLANVLEYEGGETNERLWHEGVSWEEIKFVFTDVKVYLYAIIEFGILISFYSLSLSLTGIIEGMGFSNTAIIQLMTVPPFAIAWISCVAISYTAGRLKERGFFTSAAIFIGLIGFVLLIVLKPYGFFPLYLASTLACTGTFTAIPLNLSWVTSNISGQTKRAISLSTIIGFSNLAGIVSSQIYREDDRPEIIPSHTTGYIVCISFMSVSLLVALFLKYHLSRENRLQ